MSSQIKLPPDDTFFRKQRNVLDWGATEFSIVYPHLCNLRTCLDIGAHCGITSIRYAKAFQEVHAFEPLHCDLLDENTQHLQNVIVHSCAVSDTAGVIEMYPNPTNSGGGIIPMEYNISTIKKRYTGPTAKLKGVEKVSVKCLPIDMFKFTSVDLIKIDVEGYIKPVINGMIKTLTNNSPVIQMELSFESQNEYVHTILTKLGYVIFNKHKRDVFYYREYKNIVENLCNE